jgi:serine protease Do
MSKSLVAAAMLCLCLCGCVDHSKLASSTLYVDLGDGHGSGVHIGNGLVLTAFHVVDDEAHISIKDTNGIVHNTELMWANKTYDVALLRISDFKNVKSRSLSCRYLDQGELLSFEGNPYTLDLLTSWGHLAKSQIAKVGDWKEAYVVDGTLGPGMSGGPAIDRYGYVVGINVGGIGNSNFITIVPSRTVCALLAR